MEVRGQDKVIGMPTTLDYNPPNRVGSSSKLSSPALPSSEIRRIDQTALGLAHGNNTIFIQSQTLDPHHHPHHLSSVDHHHNQPQPLNPQPAPLKPRRDPDPNPDPIPSPIVVCTPSATPTTTAIPSGSNSFKAPPAAPPTPASKSVRYRECLRNHAASSGGHVLDGCGEFMPSSCTAEEEDNPEALKCAACECHRNFHRKEVEGGGGDDHHYNYYIYNHNKNNITSRRDHYYSVPAVPPQQALHPPPPPQHHPIRHHPHQYHHHQQNPPMMMAFGGGGGGGGTAAESSSEDLNINVYQSNYAAAAGQLARKKRFRTKFSQEQKEKMMGLAEKLGWRIQKHDEEEVQQLCAQVGIKRQVFKVWMHNNKQAMKKKEAN